MRWKKHLKVADLRELVNQHKINGLSGPDIVTAIVNSHSEEYKVNIVKILEISAEKG